MRQAGDDVLDHTVGKELLLRVGAHVLKREDRDHRPVGQVRGVRCRRRHRGRGVLSVLHRVEYDAIDPHRPDDVLELLLTFVGKADVEPAVDVLLHARRDADAAGLRQAFEAGRHVHAVSQDVAVLLHDDVADIDADTQVDPLVGRQAGVLHHQPALQVDGATDGVDDAGEFGQQAVTRGLHQAATVFGEAGEEQVSLKGFQAPQRAFLIGAHQPAVARDIGGENGRKPSVKPFTGQEKPPQ